MQQEGRRSDSEELRLLSAEQWQRWYESLGSLDRRSIGAASSRAFAWIWLRCKGRPAENLRLYLPDLAARFGKSLKTAQYWLDYLERKGLLWVRNRTLKARPPEGWVLLDVYHPNPELRDRPLRVDPQLQFRFMEGEAGAPPIAARGSSPSAQGLPANIDPSLPANSARGFGKLRQKPCQDAVLDAVRSGQVSMTQALTLLTEPKKAARAPPLQRAESSRVRNLISKSKLKSKSKFRAGAPDQEALDQKAFELRIVQELGDPELRPQPVRKVACKLAEGRLAWEEVQQAIDNARQCYRDRHVDAPWIYFVGAMRKAFEEREWPWRSRKIRSSHPT